MVEPLVRACTDNHEGEVAHWRRRHGELVAVHKALRLPVRQNGTLRQARVAGMVPAQMPADVDAFTGRTRELAELDRLLAGAADRPVAADTTETAVVISAVSGTAGVGKTALAVRWTHRMREKFPDGQFLPGRQGRCCGR